MPEPRNKIPKIVKQHVEIPITKVARTDVESNAESYSNPTGYPLGVPIST